MYNKQSVDSALADYEVKNAKVIKLKNNYNYPVCYKLANIGSNTQLNLLYIASRVNGFSKIKGTGVYNKQISNLLGAASIINEWTTYIIVDNANNVYVVIASFSEITILNSCYSTTGNLISPTWVGNVPSYVDHD